MKGFRILFSLSLWSVMALLLAGVGCDDPVDLGDPRPPSGNIYGQVMTGGVPAGAQILAEKITGNWNLESRYLVEADYHGFYSLDVGPGKYFMEVRFDGAGFRYQYSDTGLTWGNVPRDTLVIGKSDPPRNIDFDLAGVTLDMIFPAEFNGKWVELVLHRSDIIEDGHHLTNVDQGGSYIKSGHLVIELPGVLPGRYQAVIVMGRVYSNDGLYDSEHFWVPGTRDRNESPWFEVGVDSVVALDCHLPTAPAGIEGRISGAWLDMNLGNRPYVGMVTLDSIPLFEHGQVESDGRFALDVMLPEPVKLFVRQGDIDQWIGGPDFQTAEVFELQPGETISGVEFAQSGIHFFVDAPASATGTGNVEIYRPDNMEMVASVRHTFPVRHLAVANLWPGDYLIRVSPADGDIGKARWFGQWFDGVETADQAQVVSITEHGEIVSLDLTLEIGGGIRGSAKTATGYLFNYYVVVTPADEKTSLSDQAISFWFEPNYEFWGLPDGDFKIGFMTSNPQVDPISDETVWYPGTTDWDQADVLEIREAGIIDGVDIILPSLDLGPSEQNQ